MPPGFGWRDFYYLLPELVLTAGACVLLIVDVVLPRSRRVLAWVTVGILALAALSLIAIDGVNTTVARGLVAVDSFAFFFKILFILAATLTVSLGAWNPRPRTWRGTMVSAAPVPATVFTNRRRLMLLIIHLC